MASCEDTKVDNNCDKGCCCHNDSSDSECKCDHSEGTKEQCKCKEQNTQNEQFDFNQDFPMPKPTLITFATSLAQQAMVSMGILPNPITKKSVFMMNQASFLIDTIVMIIEKTEGNRTEEETKTLDNVVHELRMLYVAAMNEKKRREETGSKGE